MCAGLGLGQPARWSGLLWVRRWVSWCMHAARVPGTDRWRRLCCAGRGSGSGRSARPSCRGYEGPARGAGSAHTFDCAPGYRGCGVRWASQVARSHGSHGAHGLRVSVPACQRAGRHTTADASLRPSHTSHVSCRSARVQRGQPRHAAQAQPAQAQAPRLSQAWLVTLTCLPGFGARKRPRHRPLCGTADGGRRSLLSCCPYPLGPLCPCRSSQLPVSLLRMIRRPLRRWDAGPLRRWAAARREHARCARVFLIPPRRDWLLACWLLGLGGGRRSVRRTRLPLASLQPAGMAAAPQAAGHADRRASSLARCTPIAQWAEGRGPADHLASPQSRPRPQ